MIATGEAATSLEELPPSIRALIESASEIVVVTPVLVSGLQWLASDSDRAHYEADERLAAVLGHVEALAPGASVKGEVGNDTPITALDDVMRRFRPDHILIALRSSDHDAWQEQGLLDEIRQAFHLPMTVFEIDRAGHVTTWAVAHKVSRNTMGGSSPRSKAQVVRLLKRDVQEAEVLELVGTAERSEVAYPLTETAFRTIVAELAERRAACEAHPLPEAT